MCKQRVNTANAIADRSWRVGLCICLNQFFSSTFCVHSRMMFDFFLKMLEGNANSSLRLHSLTHSNSLTHTQARACTFWIQNEPILLFQIFYAISNTCQAEHVIVFGFISMHCWCWNVRPVSPRRFASIGDFAWNEFCVRYVHRRYLYPHQHESHAHINGQRSHSDNNNLASLLMALMGH